MKISVIVPAFNEEKLLGATLECIRAATTGLDPELIVCDNNSTDRTAEIARAAGATVVFEPLNQISRARNAGAAAASGDWLVFVDADSMPSRELFAELAGAIAAGRCIGGGATVRFDDADRSARAAVGVWNAISRTMRWAAGSFVFCQAAAFRKIGGFSTELYASEEIDFSRRLKRLGPLTILHRHPLRTSGRKVRLYTKTEWLKLLAKVALSGGRALRNRDECFAWYDGRR
ncbi:MAG TPA: glycosyltransferase [Burkholderiales bacterium]|nr:glycosyltransferase [Burkholderiales bacterium]